MRWIYYRTSANKANICCEYDAWLDVVSAVYTILHTIVSCGTGTNKIFDIALCFWSVHFSMYAYVYYCECCNKNKYGSSPTYCIAVLINTAERGRCNFITHFFYRSFFHTSMAYILYFDFFFVLIGCLFACAFHAQNSFCEPRKTKNDSIWSFV